MKPAFGMDGKNTETHVHPSEDVPATSNRRSLVYGIIIGLVSTLVITGVALVTFYVGMKSGKDSYKEAWMTFKSPWNFTPIKERVILKGKEAEFIRPGMLKVVIDYHQNMLVMQSDRELNGDEPIVCYVYEFESGMFGSEEDAEKAIKPGLSEVQNEFTLTVEKTGEELPLEKLSPMARDMCFGAQTLKVRQSEADKQGLQKRWSTGDTGGVFLDFARMFRIKCKKC